MSNTENKSMNVEEEILDVSYYSDSSYSFEDRETHEIVLALPALSVSERSDVDEKILNEAAVAANLIVEAAKVAEEKKKTDQTVNVTSEVSESPVSKKSRRPLDDLAKMSGSVGTDSVKGKEPVKKPRRKSCSQLTNQPPGTPTCPVCGKVFISLKAVFGHLRLHKDRGYTGFLPPPTFNAAEEGLGGVHIAASSSSSVRLGIDLNVPVEEEEEEEEIRKGSRVIRNFDLNKEPEDKEDNAE